MTITNVAAAATALSAALVLTACGGTDTSGAGAHPAPSPTGASAPSTQPAAEHNDADIAFAQGMIPHHQQAVTMSQLAADRAGSDDVRGLAAAIEQAQGPEMGQMRGFLADWGAPETAGTDHESMDHGATGHGGMAGMMTEQQMQQLEQSSAAEFDRMFLQMMIAHHEGAVQMARAELADGVAPEARTLAQQIIDTQQEEIGRMRGLLG